MRTQLEFVSDAFPAYPQESDSINPGIWGRRLAEFISAGLPAHGFQPGEPIAEDWGWCVPIKHDAFPMFVGCSNQVEPGGNRFLCLIDPSTPTVKKGFFTKVDTRADVERLAQALETVLRTSPDIRDLVWTDDSDPDDDEA